MTVEKYFSIYKLFYAFLYIYAYSQKLLNSLSYKKKISGKYLGYYEIDYFKCIEYGKKIILIT